MGRSAAAFMVAVGVVAGAGWHSTTVPTDYRPMGRQTPLYHVAVVGDSYTTGGDEGGLGPKGWANRAWQLLAGRGMTVSADVAAEGGAGYGQPGNRGSVFEGLAARAIHPDDDVVVFYGSRNDQNVAPPIMAGVTRSALEVARRVAPTAQLLVIGPPWPTADVPPAVLTLRDVVADAAYAEGAVFVDPIAEGWFVGRPGLIGRDGVHPTDAGHAYMAELIAPLIAARLPAST